MKNTDASSASNVINIFRWYDSVELNITKTKDLISVTIIIYQLIKLLK